MANSIDTTVRVAQLPSIDHGMTAEKIRELVETKPYMLEIGSHEGTDTLKFLQAMPDIILRCFEPDQRAVARFKRAMQEIPTTVSGNVELFEKGVTDVDGTKLFYASTGKAGHMEDWDYSGSFSRPTHHYVRSPEIKFKDPVAMPCIRLDTWWAEICEVPNGVRGGRLDFIWADVQGGQIPLIAGGRRALACTRYLYIECHQTPEYEDEPTQAELVIMLLPEFEPVAIYGGDNILFKNRYV